MKFNLEPFNPIENVTIYHNKKYYILLDDIHIKEIFNGNNDIICFYHLDKIKNLFKNDYINIMYCDKININNLVFNIKIKYITINEYSNELICSYFIKDA